MNRNDKMLKILSDIKRNSVDAFRGWGNAGPVEATIICHPEDADFVENRIMDCISLVTDEQVPRGTYYASGDIEARPDIQIGATNEDLRNGEMTLIVDRKFYLK